MKRNTFKKRIIPIMMGMIVAGASVTTQIAPIASSVVYATESANTTGTINIGNAVNGTTYSLYKMLTLESFDATSQKYSYKVTNDWNAFFTDNQYGINGTYFDTDKSGFVTEADDLKADTTGSMMKTFGEKAKEYAKAKNLTPNATGTKQASGALSFTGLGLGYYLVDSSLGIVCSVDSTDTTVTINEKNSVPTVEKKVEEGTNFVDASDAKIGDTVKYKSTVTLGNGTTNLVLHDTMEQGLTLNTKSIKVLDKDGNAIDTSNYDVYYATADSPIKHNAGTDNETTTAEDFEVVFKNDYIQGKAAGTELIVTYEATLNKDAEINTGATGENNRTNDNDTYLTYGEDSSFTSDHDTVTTKTYEFEVYKTDSANKVISGAQFNLYDTAENGTPINLILVKGPTNDNGIYEYRVAEAGETGTTTTIDAGKAIIKGLDSRTYYLEETNAPDGYNKLDKRVTVDLSNGTDVSSDTNLQDGSVLGEIVTAANGGIQVVNNTGNRLPSTGGAGTTVIYIVGGGVVAAAGTALVITMRKKKGKNNA